MELISSIVSSDERIPCKTIPIVDSFASEALCVKYEDKRRKRYRVFFRIAAPLAVLKFYPEACRRSPKTPAFGEDK